ncbi:MAG: YitT family protein, partial [Ruminococcaceae bacterium]|nr:YitT family protein [Oscillospiraceae bacterium]
TILYTFNIPPGLVYLLVNLVLLALGYKVLGKAFAINSFIAVVYVSALVQFFSGLEPLTDDILLSTLFGSAIFGFGAVLTFIENANTGGTDIIARLVQSGFSHFPIGRLLLVIDTIIIVASMLVFRDINLALYGILGLFVSTAVIDFFIDALNSSKLAFVITDKGEKICELLLNNSKRGVTILNARGAYSMERKNMLVCALKAREMPEFHKRVTSCDENAFIIFTKTEKIFGLGFYVYK